MLSKILKKKTSVRIIAGYPNKGSGKPIQPAATRSRSPSLIPQSPDDT